MLTLLQRRPLSDSCNGLGITLKLTSKLFAYMCIHHMPEVLQERVGLSVAKYGSDADQSYTPHAALHISKLAHRLCVTGCLACK